MNTDVSEGKWNQIKGQAKQRWARFTDDDLRAIDGRVDELQGKLQEKYQLSKEDAKKEIEEFESSIH